MSSIESRCELRRPLGGKMSERLEVTPFFPYYSGLYDYEDGL